MKKFFFLNLIKKILKSIGKKEEKINDLIILKNFKKKFSSRIFKYKKVEFNKKNSNKFKLVATITFLYDFKKIKFLNEVCQNLKLISKNLKIFIITDEKSKHKINFIKKKINLDLSIITVNDLLSKRLLPWYHIKIMKSQFKNKEISHFINIEDDTILNKENFIYWINARKLLKKFNLIPGFVRTETNKKNKQLYVVDIIKKTKLSKLPRFYINDKYSFLNQKFPYQGLYLYDRSLMKEYLSSPAIDPDCGHGGFNIKYLDSNMINQSLLEKANLGLTYIHTPEGFHNRIAILFNNEKNVIDQKCLINHLPNKYTNQKSSSYGNIKLLDAFYD